MKRSVCGAGVITVVFGLVAALSARPARMAATSPSPSQSPPAQTPAGQKPAAPGQTPAAPRRVQPRMASPHVFVRDPSGTPIAGARILVSGAATRDVTTDAHGEATVTAIRDGLYRLRFERDGFITLEREVTIRSGQPAEIDVVLNAAPEPPPAPPPAPAPQPAPPPPPPPSGPPVSISVPAFLDKNFIGREPLKESVLGCTSDATTRLLQLRDPLALHTHADLDEVLYVVAGEGSVRIRDDSSAIEAGSLTIVPRGVPHAIEHRGKNPLILISTLAGLPCQADAAARAVRQAK
jgi:mannose-6-phosphate isomerase-like protein (cupin superfamily)